jgi:hypothetical protein
VIPLQRCGVVEDFAGHAGQAGAAVPLGGVERFAVRMLLPVDRQALVDEKHARGRDRRHPLQVVADRNEVLGRYDSDGLGVGDSHAELLLPFRQQKPQPPAELPARPSSGAS